ncbi:MAG: hypothetical protein KAU31_12830 [Spirochaetaceae bacterium]|nr:hypothetical protein [Spirochaetaceae bacterium]
MERNFVRPGRSGRIVGFAGSRNGRIENGISVALLAGLSRRGFRLVVGCANGVDRCILEAVADSAFANRCTVHCAFPSRVQEVEAIGLKAVHRVADISSAAAALHWRTVLMIRECSLLVLFPDDPTTGTWGKGSRLAFNMAIQRHIPVFVVTTIPPLETKQYQVEEGSLFGIIDGHWVVPQGVEVP